MRGVAIFAAGAFTGAAVAALVLTLRPVPPASASAQPAPRVTRSALAAAVPPEATLHRDRAAHVPGVQAAEPVAEVAAEAVPDPVWEAIVGGMLAQEVERRFGARLAPQKKARLLDALARLREASLGLQQAPSDPRTAGDLRERLARQLALLEADRTFRAELGVGAAEFLQGLDAGAIEDVSTPH